VRGEKEKKQSEMTAPDASSFSSSKLILIFNCKWLIKIGELLVANKVISSKLLEISIFMGIS